MAEIRLYSFGDYMSTYVYMYIYIYIERERRLYVLALNPSGPLSRFPTMPHRRDPSLLVRYLYVYAQAT